MPVENEAVYATSMHLPPARKMLDQIYMKKNGLPDSFKGLSYSHPTLVGRDNQRERFPVSLAQAIRWLVYFSLPTSTKGAQ
jgi:hypothetical protein